MFTGKAAILIRGGTVQGWGGGPLKQVRRTTRRSGRITPCAIPLRTVGPSQRASLDGERIWDAAAKTADG